MKKMLRITGMAILFMGTFVFMGTFASTEAIAGAESKCKMCHDFGSKNKVGPGLGGIFGRAAGSTDFKKYSPSMKKGGWVWDEANLRIFLTNTSKGIKTLSGDKSAKSKMKVKVKAAKLDETIAFLKGLK